MGICKVYNCVWLEEEIMRRIRRYDEGKEGESEAEG